MSKDTIPTFQGIDLTGIDPFLAIQANTLLDTCSLEIFRLIALLHKCKQENPATEKLADDLTEALKAILDAHERDVVVRNNYETAQKFCERALLAEEKIRKLNDTVSELHGQIHELEAQLEEKRGNSAQINNQGEIMNLKMQIAMLQQNAYMQSLRECVQTSSLMFYDGRLCIMDHIMDQRGKFI